MRKIIILFSIFLLSTAFSNTFFLGAGPGLSFVDHEDQIQMHLGEIAQTENPHTVSNNFMGDAVIGVERKLGPRTLLDIEGLQEWVSGSSSNHSSTGNGINSSQINTTEKNTETYGILLQPGLQARNYDIRMFFDIGWVRSKFSTQVQQNIEQPNISIHQTFQDQRWVNGLRLGLSSEAPLGFGNLYNRTDFFFTRYQPWTVNNAKTGLSIREKPTSLNVVWNIIWKIT